MDSLVNAQIKYLSANEVTLNKTAIINGKEERSTIRPDSLLWANEFDILRKADITRPAYNNAFKITEEEDLQSNLKILRYEAKGELPVKTMWIYFLEDKSDLRRIKVTIEDDTKIFSNDKEILMNFEKIQGVTVLKNYEIRGKQKMMLSDTTLYLISGNIEIL